MNWCAYYQELADFHQEILRSAAELKSVVRQESMAKDKSAELYGLVVEYLSKQNEEFYASLRAVYAGNRSALKRIDFFVQDMKHLKVNIFVFEEKYLVGCHNRRDPWTHDCLEFVQEILARLQIEQAQLLPLVSAAGTSVAS